MRPSIELIDVVMNRLWTTYEVTDDRRRKAFFLLFTFSLTFGSILSFQSDETVLPLFTVSIPIQVAMEFGPVFIASLLVSYFYLCSHTLKSYVTYLEFLTKHATIESQKQTVKENTFGWLYGNLKRRDITEGFNIYHFPIIPIPEYDDSFDRGPSIWGHLPINALAVIMIIFPLAVYCSCVYWIIIDRDNHLNVPYSIFSQIGADLWMIKVFYFGLFLLSISAYIYFKKRAKPSRAEFIKRCYPSNFESIVGYYGTFWAPLVANLLKVPRETENR